MKNRPLALGQDPNLNSLTISLSCSNLSTSNFCLSSPIEAWELPKTIRDLDVMSTAEGSEVSDGSGDVLNLPQLKRSGRAHRGVLTRRATRIQQDGGLFDAFKQLWSSSSIVAKSWVIGLLDYTTHPSRRRRRPRSRYGGCCRCVHGRRKNSEVVSGEDQWFASSEDKQRKASQTNFSFSQWWTRGGPLSGTKLHQWLTAKLTLVTLRSYHTSSCHWKVMQLI